MSVAWNLSRLPELVTPSLIVNVDAVRRNITRMISTAGHASHLRPHVKTHKSPDVVSLQCDAGINSFKAATLSEARAAIGGGAKDILLAHSPVGAKIPGLIDLCKQYPGVNLSTIVDDARSLPALDDAFTQHSVALDAWIDVDCGMGRTGILPADVGQLADSLQACSALRFAGLHVYDGHLHQPSVAERTAGVDQIHRDVLQIAGQVGADRVIVGGSPTFAIWAEKTSRDSGGLRWQFSPGTPVYWDVGYASAFPDLPFEIAAGVLTSVVSRPADPSGRQRFCLDAGTKSLASEMPLEQRAELHGFPDASIISQSEEHLVITGIPAEAWDIGQSAMLFPRHICPTVAKFHQATVVDDSMTIVGTWAIAARHGL